MSQLAFTELLIVMWHYLSLDTDLPFVSILSGRIMHEKDKALSCIGFYIWELLLVVPP